ncbi:quinone oxidoreductase family protein [Mycolicibacterium holsaticum]|uniref:Alcohol dehydrogenase n=1 Tax=Mycolicibacterium holsaticum TaxID=152142 RepID=A0A1E3S367_9MYCO|nr:zinc-binding dehydrogenase [Mycolicibacterium holsaticum]ODQ96568.1 alcohol dehydrogenase [Mycolicibacterium holsaticum]
MKAIRMYDIGGPDVLRLDEVDVPGPGDGQVLIKVEAAGVAYGDIMKRQGAFGQDLPLPVGLGLQIAGAVAELGDGVSGPAPGTRVMAWVADGYAQYAVAPTTNVVPIPNGVESTDAAVLPVQGLTAYQTLLEAGNLQPDESVLVHAAAGGVGGLAVQLAHLCGAGAVIGTASTPEKLEYIRQLGATAVDYTRDDWSRSVLDATGGRGVDLVLDSVGGAVTTRSLECLAPFGRTVCFGAASGTVAAIPTMALMPTNLSVTGYSLDGWLARRDRVANAVEKLLGYVATKQINVVVAQEFPLEKAAEAHHAIGDRNTVGATVLVP